MIPHPVFPQMGVTVFETMSALAREHGAINLGQGFPESAGPLSLRRLAGEALLWGSNQYPPSRGLLELRHAVIEHYGRHQGVPLELEGVLVTSGATEALAACLIAFIQPGDEVLVIEPAYDAYRPLIERAGGIVRSIRLAPPLWRLEAELLDAVVTGRTRAILFNTPHNPSARAFDVEEIAALARFCVRHDLLAISDEVWEHVIFDGRRHQTLLAMEGMAARTLKIGSAGKMFGMTGWKVGFVCGSPDLVEVVARAHQYLTFSTPPHLQVAVASGLSWDKAAFVAQAAELSASRDRLAKALVGEGFSVTPSQGTYFLNIDLVASGVALSDEDFCMRIVSEFGVAAIPVSAFMTGSDCPAIVRLCFAKADPVLDEASHRLGRARRALATA